MADKPARKPIHVQMNLRYPVDPLEILHVNVVRFSHVGADVFMDVGVIDDQELLRLRGESDNPPDHVQVAAYIQRRYGMSVESLKNVRRNVEEIWAKMKASGAIVEDEP